MEAQDSPARTKRRATWAKKVALGGTGAVLVAIATAWAVHLAGPRKDSPAPALRAELRRALGDYPVELRKWGHNGGQLMTLWELTISNAGDRADAVTSYQLLSLDASGRQQFYSGLDRGLLDRNLAPTNLPIVVNPGHAERIFVKAGINVAPRAYELLNDSAAARSVRGVESLHRYLFRQGIDIHGLPVQQLYEGTFSFPEADKAPSLAVIIEAASGKRIPAVASWYPTIERR